MGFEDKNVWELSIRIIYCDVKFWESMWRGILLDFEVNLVNFVIRVVYNILIKLDFNILKLFCVLGFKILYKMWEKNGFCWFVWIYKSYFFFSYFIVI